MPLFLGVAACNDSSFRCNLFIRCSSFTFTALLDSEGVWIPSEFMKSTIDLGDLIGFYFIMNSISAKGELKFLVAGVGWATAELIMTRVVPMWVGARGTEFDWKYIQLSLESNVNLVQHISTAALVWLWSRHDLNKSVQPIVVTLLALSSYKPLVVE
eukprot:XP_001190748.2 PREDICTED: transmembrane protein 147-like [Strongylocentrotus purpuratus]